MNERDTNPREIVTQYKYHLLLHDACYDRSICERAGADYSRMNETDLAKLRAYLNQSYEVKE